MIFKKTCGRNLKRLRNLNVIKQYLLKPYTAAVIVRRIDITNQITSYYLLVVIQKLTHSNSDKPFILELQHLIDKAMSFLANYISAWYPNTIKVNLSSIGTMHAKLFNTIRAMYT